MTPHLKSPKLEAAGAPHGFFGRAGGVSSGMFHSLNAGLGSIDAPESVAENRRRCRAALGADYIVTLYQHHSPDVVAVDAPWQGAGPRADGMATTQRGIALGVLAADCMPFLFVDAEAGVIGAAHAGWRGALSGVLEATIDLMVRLGARRERIFAAVGPCLRPPSFEVGLELLENFTNKYPSAERFFAPAAAPAKRQLDLVAFGRWRLAESGVGNLDDLGVCTLDRRQDYFSYRASRRAQETDYGRNLSAIVLP